MKEKQKTEKLIPYIIGITGHRDFVINQDTDRLLKLLFNYLKINLKNTPVILISPLADGADQYVAEKFFEYKEKYNLDMWELIVPMPFKKEDYLKTIENKEKFDSLLTKAKEFYPIESALSGDFNDRDYREEQYKNIGEFIADNSNILIALYDGKKINKKGGTSKIVEFKREGFKDCVFDSAEGSFLYWVKVERKNIHSEDISIEVPEINDYDIRYLQEITNTKKVFANLGIEVLGYKVDSLKTYTQILKEMNDVNKYIKNNFEKKHIAFKDRKDIYSEFADTNQMSFRNWGIVFIVLGFFIVFGLELYHNFETEWGLVLYALFITAAFVIYPVIKRYEYDKKWYTFRVLSEFLRFQDFWFKGKIKDRQTEKIAKVSKYALPQNFTKWIWIKIALNGIYADEYGRYLKEKSETEALKTEWIEYQKKYFENKIKNFKKLKLWENCKKISYILGIVFSFITVILGVLEMVHIELEQIHIKHWIHSSFFTSAIALLIAVMIEEKIFDNMFTKEEEEKTYRLMYKIYSSADKKIKEKGDQNRIYFCLGLQAIYEVGKWLEKRSQKKLELPLE